MNSRERALIVDAAWRLAATGDRENVDLAIKLSDTFHIKTFEWPPDAFPPQSDEEKILCGDRSKQGRPLGIMTVREVRRAERIVTR